MSAARPAIVAAALALVALSSAAPAQALSITAPGSTNLGSATAGQTITTQLGSVTVSSNASLLSGWTATVTLSGQFTVTQSGQSATFPATRVRYWSGAATATSGITAGICLPGQATSGLAVTLASARTAYSCGAIIASSSSLTWNPTLVVTTQGSDPVGTYSGTITHSVA